MAEAGVRPNDWRKGDRVIGGMTSVSEAIVI